ncbi:MAG: phosphoribosyltransferase [Anaerolineales bacterium]|nr:phosphoribosyltransferase [Anaerolineales bacterium]
MIRFINRCDAGQQLAVKLVAYENNANVIVLGIPRGGVVVAAEIARALHVPLDVFITRKIGAPFNHELALGAVASDGTVVLDEPLIHELGVSHRQIERECENQKHEIRRRSDLYRQDRRALELENKTVIVVDDGIATGSTMLAALRALRQKKPARIVLAVPVAPFQTVPLLRAECDELVLLGVPEPFIAVGYFYADFEQVTDEEVIQRLRGAA